MEKILHPELNNLIAFIDTIDAELSCFVSSEDGNNISNKIGRLVALVSASANAVAMAGMIYNDRLGEELENLSPKMSATDKKLILTGKLSKEMFYKTQVERQNAALVHAIDGYRSMLSFLKEDMKLNNQYTPNVPN